MLTVNLHKNAKKVKIIIRFKHKLLTMSVKVDQEKCIGCGRCTEICPEVFKLNEEGKSTVIKIDGADCALKAADECPVEAIFVEE